MVGVGGGGGVGGGVGGGGLSAAAAAKPGGNKRTAGTDEASVGLTVYRQIQTGFERLRALHARTDAADKGVYSRLLDGLTSQMAPLLAPTTAPAPAPPDANTGDANNLEAVAGLATAAEAKDACGEDKELAINQAKQGAEEVETMKAQLAEASSPAKLAGVESAAAVAAAEAQADLGAANAALAANEAAAVSEFVPGTPQKLLTPPPMLIVPCPPIATGAASSTPAFPSTGVPKHRIQSTAGGGSSKKRKKAASAAGPGTTAAEDAAVNAYNLALADYATNADKRRTLQILKGIKKADDQKYVLKLLGTVDNFNPADEIATNGESRAALLSQCVVLGVPFLANE